MNTLAPTLQAFFTDRLIRQRHASSHTIAAYREILPTLAQQLRDPTYFVKRELPPNATPLPQGRLAPGYSEDIAPFGESRSERNLDRRRTGG